MPWSFDRKIYFDGHIGYSDTMSHVIYTGCPIVTDHPLVFAFQAHISISVVGSAMRGGGIFMKVMRTSTGLVGLPLGGQNVP